MKHRETGRCVWAACEAVNAPHVRDAQSLVLHMNTFLWC